MDVIMVDEEELRAMAATDDLIDPDQGMALLRALSDAMAAEGGVATAWRAEGPALSVVEVTEDLAYHLMQGAAAFAGRPGEEALVSTLQSKAAEAEEVRAKAAEVAAVARRMREDEVRRMAANENLIDPKDARDLRNSSRTMAEIVGTIPTPKQAAAAVIGEIAAVSMAEKTAEQLHKLRWGAAAFEGRPGEEALVVALRNKAAAAEELLHEAEVVAATMRRYRLSLPIAVPVVAAPAA